MKRWISSAVLPLLLVPRVALGQEEKPQYSVEDIQKSFSRCAPDRTAAPDGSCQPRIGDTRGFSIARPERETKPNHDSKPAAAPPNRTNKRPTRQPSAIVAEGPTLKRDLLITFANASTELTPQGKANARVFAQALATPQLRNVRFAIDGHTNAVGGAEFNKRLSLARAQAVVRFLTVQGVDATRLEINGFGYEQLSNPRDPRAASNRRVEARRLD